MQKKILTLTIEFKYTHIDPSLSCIEIATNLDWQDSKSRKTCGFSLGLIKKVGHLVKSLRFIPNASFFLLEHTTHIFYFGLHLIFPLSRSSLISTSIFLFTWGMCIRWASTHILVFLHSWNLFNTFQIKFYGALCY